MNIKNLIGVLLLLLSSLSGCIYSDYPHSPSIELYFTGDINQPNENKLRLYGNIGQRVSEKDIRIDNFSVNLYTQDGELLFRKNFGSYHTGGYLEMNISHQRRPKYIVFASPDIWRRNDISIQYLVKNSDGYYDRNWTNTGETLPDIVREDLLNNT